MKTKNRLTAYCTRLCISLEAGILKPEDAVYLLKLAGLDLTVEDIQQIYTETGGSWASR